MKSNKIKIGVIIATSLNRTQKLLLRSLPSVFSQTRLPDYILVVDDNSDASTRNDNKAVIQTMSKQYNFDTLFYIENLRTKGMSGTGAWNTAIVWYERYLNSEDYVAILDDDDSWENTYLEKCEEKVSSAIQKPDEVVAFLKRTDCKEPHIFSLNDLCINNFLTGNPGVQGSNMFFKFESLKNIDGFDENLSSCTDRDLMIRFLSQTPKPDILIIDEVLVNHFAGPETITYDIEKKEKGLDAFYKKFIALYSEDILLQTLKRSKELFSYQNTENIYKLWKLTHRTQDEEKIVIGMALHNNALTIRRAVESVLSQTGLKTKLYILIVDDSSEDDWKSQIQDILKFENIIYWKVYHKNVSKTRNFINNFIRDFFGNVKLIGRLDSDDEYSSDDVLSKIEFIKDDLSADVVFAGNYLKQDGKIIAKVNRAKRELADHKYLLNLLKNMSEGTAENELPSCNTFMTLKSLQVYPDIQSAEDHFVTARLLWNKKNLKLAFAEDVLLTVYNLNGKLTEDNRKQNIYISARKKLYAEVLSYEK